uniref:Diacylglycerol O-acyltransferase 1 n=1 Tax=Oryzias latipes TaxID=8090 RepID=A0A3P9L1S5_ORYLA
MYTFEPLLLPRPCACSNAPRRLSCSCHVLQESLLSSASGYSNYRGILNWCVVMLVNSLSSRYGILVDPIQVVSLFLKDPYSWPAACLIIGEDLRLRASCEEEADLTAGTFSETSGWILHIFNLLFLLVFSSVTVLTVPSLTPVGGVLSLGVYTVLFLKLYSYQDANRWCRESRQAEAKPHAEEGHQQVFGSDICVPALLPRECSSEDVPALGLHGNDDSGSSGVVRGSLSERKLWQRGRVDVPHHWTAHRCADVRP